MSLQIPDEFVQDSSLIESGKFYDLVQIVPTVIVDGMTLNYVLVNKETGAYEQFFGVIIEARGIFQVFERISENPEDAQFSLDFGDSEETCH